MNPDLRIVLALAYRENDIRDAHERRRQRSDEATPPQPVVNRHAVGHPVRLRLAVVRRFVLRGA